MSILKTKPTDQYAGFQTAFENTENKKHKPVKINTFITDKLRGLAQSFFNTGPIRWFAAKFLSD